jgi:capsular polysaccharide biosynthesis protein
MTFVEEVGAYRFRLFGPRFNAAGDGRYRLPRADGSSATVLESPQLVIETNNVQLGPVEAELKPRLRELSSIPKASTLASGAVVNAAVRHMPEDAAFLATGIGHGFMFLAGMLGNDERTCVGIEEFGSEESARAFRGQFDARRSHRHSFVDGSWREYLASGAVPPIGVLVHNAGDTYRDRFQGLQAIESLLAEECLIIVNDANWDWCRQAALDFAHDSRLGWRTVLYERTAGEHPTLWNGLLVMSAGGGRRESDFRLTTETGLDDPVDVHDARPASTPPRITVLHYRNPWVGVQDYPNLEIIGLDRGRDIRDAFEGGTGDYVVVLDPEVELTPSALSEAVREAEGGAPLVPDARIEGESEAAGDGTGESSPRRRPWRSVSSAQRRRHRAGSGLHDPVAQADYFPSWAGTFDEGRDPQTVTVARALSVMRDNLVALDVDLNMDDVDREIAVRFSRGLRLEGPAARCSRVPDGVVAGRAGAVLTPDGRWVIESVGSVTRAWPELALDDHGRVALSEPPRESHDRVATIVCERRREWWNANFGHWTFDTLTRVAMLLRAEVPDDVKLLVPEPVLPFQRETLLGLGITEHRIVPWDGRPTRFREVYVPTARPGPPFLFPAGVELLRELGGGTHETVPGRRLFVSRRQLTRTTRVANEEELLEVAIDYGFDEITPERLPYSEQVRRFSEAQIVAGPHGSGLANAIFMARGTGLCELAPARLHAEKVPNFWNLAACGRQRYGLCVASGRKVDPKRFRRVVRDMVRAVPGEPADPVPVAKPNAAQKA